MQDSRDAVEDVLESKNVVYGINTGFWSTIICSDRNEQLETLQENLVRSHACGVGERMEPETVLLMMVIRANSLARGVSGQGPISSN